MSTIPQLSDEPRGLRAARQAQNREPTLRAAGGCEHGVSSFCIPSTTFYENLTPTWPVSATGPWLSRRTLFDHLAENCRDLVIHFTLVMNQAILGLALLAAKTESVERRFSKTSGGGSLNGLPASKLAASICSVSAGQRGSFVRTARPRRVGRPDEARCSVAGADARPLPRREPSCTTRGCRCGVGFWPCGWPALRKQG